MRKKLILIFIIAFLIRLIGLKQSLWLDEATTAEVIKHYSWWEIITKFSPFDFHPPLYYLFMKSWSLFFGFSEIALRLPSIIFSLLTGYLIYKISRSTWATLFFLFNPLVVYYSQEARMYMMATFFVITGFYFFMKLQKKLPTQISNLKSQNSISKNDLFWMNLFLMLAFFTFYGSIFFILAILIYFFFDKQYKYLILTTLYLLLVFLIISPLLYQQWLNSKVSLIEVKNWSIVLGKNNIKNLLLIPIKFCVGRISFYPKFLYWLISGFFSFFVFYVLFKNLDIKNSLKNENFKLKILSFYLLILPLALGFLISFFVPMLQYFRFLYLLPLLAILLSFQRSATAKRIIGGGFLIFSLIYLLFPQFHREDWKSLVKSLSAVKEVYMINSSSDPVKYYNPKIKIKDLRSLSGSSSLARELAIIPYTTEIYGYNYQDILLKKGYRPGKKTAFRNLYLEEWSQR